MDGIEQEAKEFMEKNKKTTPIDKVAFRYYTGCALTALLQNAGGHRSYEDDIIENAFSWGFKMAAKEQQRT